MREAGGAEKAQGEGARRSHAPLGTDEEGRRFRPGEVMRRGSYPPGVRLFRMKVFVSQPLPEPSTSELLAGFEVVVGQPGTWTEEAPVHLADADAVIPTPREKVTEAILVLAPRLKVVANCAVGTDNVDLEACRRRGIVVTNTPGVLTEATADLAWLLVLAVTRRFREGDALIRSGSWDGWKPHELLGSSLEGKTLGVYGPGRIGTAVARRAEVFGMRVVSCDAVDGPKVFERLLAESDVVTIHTPLTPGPGGASALRSSRG